MKGYGVQPGHEAVVLGHVADGSSDGCLVGENVVAEDFAFSPVRLDESEQNAEKRAFPGAVRTQKARRAAVQGQADAVESLDPAVAEVDIPDFDAHEDGSFIPR